MLSDIRMWRIRFRYPAFITALIIMTLWFISFFNLDNERGRDKDQVSSNSTDPDPRLQISIPRRTISLDFVKNETEQLRQRRHVLDWVCVWSKGIPIRMSSGVSHGEKWYYKDQHYDLPCRECLIKQKAIVVFNSTIHGKFNFFSFAVNFSTRALPTHLFELSDKTAYFHSFEEDFEADNFFHFTKQFFFPLYYVKKETGTLNKSKDNVALFHKPWSVCPGNTSLRNASQYNLFFRMLGIEASGLSLHEELPEPVRVCYKKAIFSRGSYLDHALEAITLAQEYLGIKKTSCPIGRVVIINRSDYRRIINVEQLESVARQMGFDAQVVYLEQMSFKEQAQLIYCAEILVGVTGAGLQWAFFMRNHSGIVEIAWPHEEWPFFFTGEPEYNSKELGIRPLNFVQLSKVACKKNPEALNIYLKSAYHVDKTFSYSDAQVIVNDKRNYHFKNHGVSSLGKLLDVIVDIEAFKVALRRAKPLYSEVEIT